MLTNLRRYLRQRTTTARKVQNRRRSSRQAVLGSRFEQLEVRSLLAVTLLNGIDGLAASDNPFALSPPDSMGAVGPSSFIEPINVSLAIFNKTTGAKLSPVTSFGSFFSPLDTTGVQFSDPVIVFDEFIGKFAFGTLDFHTDSSGNPTDSRFDFAISKTSNPSLSASDWNFFRFNTDDGVGGASFDFSDFPKIGYNADGFVVSYNMFPKTFDHVSILSIKNDGTSPGIQVVPGGLTNFSFAPATMHTSSPGDPMWFVEDGNFGGGGNTVTVVKETNVFTSSPTFTFSPVAVNPYLQAPVPLQPGGDVGDSLGTRFDFSSLRTVGGTTHLVSAHAVGAGGGSRVRWYDFNVGAAIPSLIQEGEINQGAGVDTYLPSVEMGADGSIVMTFTQSSATAPSGYMSMYVTA